MSEDRVIANTLERATSTDFNVAQATQARRLTDWIMAEHAICVAPLSFQNDVSISPGGFGPQPVVTGLNVFAGSSDDVIYVGPGTLSQFSPPWDEFTGPAWTEVRIPSTDMQTGILRSIATVPYVSTAGLGLDNDAPSAYHLLCARLIEVATLTTTVDIFDVPTQAFVPTVLAKRIELRIEFQWFLGTALSSTSTVWPALDVGGTEWEPLAYVAFVFPDGVNSSSGANQGRVIDVARRVEGLTGGWIGGYGPESSVATAASLLARLSSVRSPNCGSGVVPGAISGAADGSVNGERVLISVSQDHRQRAIVDATDGASPSNWTLVHYYLCPLKGTSRRRWPLKSRSSVNEPFDTATARGLLVGSVIQPTRKRTNSTAITLYEAAGVRGRYNNQSAVEAGTALYIGSGHSFGTGAFDAIYPMVQSSGGSVLYPLGEQYYSSVWVDRWLSPIVALFAGGPYSGPLNRASALSLGGMVPHIATTVYLHVQAMGGADYSSLIFEVRNAVVTTTNGIGGFPAVASAYCGDRLAVCEMIGGVPMSGDAGLWNFASATIRVPVGWVPAAGHDDADSNNAYHLSLMGRLTSRVTGTYVPDVHVRLLGWDI